MRRPNPFYIHESMEYLEFPLPSKSEEIIKD